MPRLTAKLPSLDFWTTTDWETVRLFCGHATDILARLPTRSVQCVVTSPPYWGLRDYKTASPLEIGNEPTPDQYVANLVKVFQGVRRVLRDDGVVWLNLGDTYVSHVSSGQVPHTKQHKKSGHNGSNRQWRGLPTGNMVGIPWRVALALQADGWVLRSDIIWHKPSAMPESVKDRCSRAHEHVFMLTKQIGYFYDSEAIKERAVGGDGLTKNKRDVWSVASQPYEGGHLAPFPPELIRPMILAGTSEKGCCILCGKPVQRLIEETKVLRDRPNDYVKRTGERGTGNSISNRVAGVRSKTIGWQKACDCPGDGTRPCVVLDPFIGSGTTAAVCIEEGRYCWGIDLSGVYLRGNAIPRITDTCMAGASRRHLVEQVPAKKVVL